MLNGNGPHFDDVSENGFKKLYRRMQGIPAELPDSFWERFLADLRENPERCDSIWNELLRRLLTNDEIRIAFHRVLEGK